MTHDWQHYAATAHTVESRCALCGTLRERRAPERADYYRRGDYPWDWTPSEPPCTGRMSADTVGPSTRPRYFNSPALSWVTKRM